MKQCRKYKKCLKCKKIKEDHLFSIAKRNEDGLSDRCKECVAADTREYYQARREEHRARKAVNIKSSIVEEIKAASVVTKAPYCRFQCRQMSKRYIIPKNTICFVCGRSERLEAHLTDYSKPDKIIWLCEDHHKEVHIKI